MLEFKTYISRFATGFTTEYETNRYGSGTEMIAVPMYQTIEAIQNKSFNTDDLKLLIESRTISLSVIYQFDSQSMYFPITCDFDSINGEPAYSITIHPGDYLIWDEVIHRFVVMQESVFLMLYKESLW